jgi:beta-galactosidase
VKDVRKGPFDAGASLNGQSLGYTVGGVGWYRKHWTLAEFVAGGTGLLLPGQRICLRFDGVYQDSDVYLNGHFVGHHPYGYTGFEYDVTDYLLLGRPTDANSTSDPSATGAGQTQVQVLAVRVNNYGRNSRWYSGSGIYRHGKHADTNTVALPPSPSPLPPPRSPLSPSSVALS